MKEGFRQCMAWLHTWTGLVVGWILLFVFVTGTASYANREITRWMQPEQPMRASNAMSNADQFDIAYRHLLANPASQQSSSWTVNLINTGRSGNQLTANWSLAPEPGQNRGRTEGVILDTATGEVVEPGAEPRATAGGRALVRMHYALHYIPFDWAIRIVGICTMLMLIAIVTGVITHKKIFKDFFTFRAAKGRRSWLDAHNVLGVLALPFYLMITYSGLLFFMYAYMPLGVPLTYGFDAEDQRTYYAELSSQIGSTRLVGRTVGGGGGGGRGGNNASANADATGDESVADPPARGGMGREGTGREGAGREGMGMERSGAGERNQTGRNERSAGGERSADQPAERAGRGNNAGGANQGRGQAGNQEPAAINPVHRQAASFADLSSIVRQVESEWGHQEIRAVTITAASDSAPARLQLARANIDTIRGRGTNAQYNAVTGERMISSNQDTPATDVFGRSMLGLHEGQFARPLTRWLYFVSGILGSAMIATGLVLWTVKRRPKHARGTWHFGHMLVERLNVVAVAGLPFALAVYFWSNRLLPVDLEDRAAWEINSLFIAWLLMLIYALFRPVMQTWREVLFLAAAAYLLLPVLNFITTDRHLLTTLSSGDWILVSIEAVFIALGLMFAWAAWKVHIRMVAAQRKPAQSPGADTGNTAEIAEISIGARIGADDLAKGHA